MSLFDVIKYPISEVLTQAQLVALPKELYMKWIMESDWGEFIDKPTVYAPSHVAHWYGRWSAHQQVDVGDLAHLHKIIAEWEVPDELV